MAPTRPNIEHTPKTQLFNEEKSRWSSHSESSRAPTLTPRRSFSPSRNVCAVRQEKDSTLDTQSNTPPFQKNNDMPNNKRRSRKAHNRLLPDNSPNRPPIENLPRLDASRARRIDTHARRMTASIEYEFTHKLESSFPQMKRS